MKIVKVYPIFLLSLLCLILLSCSATPKKGWDTSIEEASVEKLKEKASRNGIIITQSAQSPELVRISKTAPWLDDSLITNYRGLPAKTAVLAILKQRPVRFDVTTDGPEVKAVPGAMTVRQHLDAIAVQSNWSYTVNKGVISFSDWQVVNYPLDFILGNKQASLSLNGISSDQVNKNSLDVTNNNLNELMEVMERILNTASVEETENQRQPSFTVLKSTNSILVSAPPNIQKQVQSALASINKIAGRNIYLDFDIYNVALREQYQRAVDLEVLRAAGINLTSQMNDDLEGTNQPFSLELEFAEGNAFDNSSLLLKALATHGEATLYNQGSLLLKNNQLGNIQTSSLDRFVEIAVDNYQSKTPAYRESVLQVLPSIVGDEINLYLALSNTDVEPYLKSLTRESVLLSNSGSNITEPRTNVEIDTIRLGEQFIIPTQIKDGETIMLAGLTNRDYRNTQSQNQLMPNVGDGVDRNQGRNEIIIVMTAHLVD